MIKFTATDFTHDFIRYDGVFRVSNGHRFITVSVTEKMHDILGARV